MVGDGRVRLRTAKGRCATEQILFPGGQNSYIGFASLYLLVASLSLLVVPVRYEYCSLAFLRRAETDRRKRPSDSQYKRCFLR